MDWLSRFPASLVIWLQTVASLAAGFALNEVSQLIRLGREDRRAAGPVLTDLFEIRHQIMAFDAMRKEIGKQFAIPDQAQLQLHNYLLALVPASTQFVERYEEAVSKLALVDPILAFRLRNQPALGPLLAHLRGLAAADQAGSAFWTQVVEPAMQPLFMQHLNELIADVARAHGLCTWWKARYRLRRPILDDNDRAIISDLLVNAKAATPRPDPNVTNEKSTPQTPK